ncbi:hypothetical protein [Acidihalobacter ferrooxydans]|uniref:Uncharacterized protein n=1 Tax=Acidihalobacter ferrooxydans TaxID=1765967 RepID=A0A1P8UFH4_9GAMM|nr:hypothetical protein [Acidihalobacter ferrooxydans]APZ42596.1 hypothetical protein BW247_05370 [Acidihalobacter ferrooxydans]
MQQRSIKTLIRRYILARKLYRQSIDVADRYRRQRGARLLSDYHGIAIRFERWRFPWMPKLPFDP